MSDTTHSCSERRTQRPLTENRGSHVGGSGSHSLCSFPISIRHDCIIKNSIIFGRRVKRQQLAALLLCLPFLFSIRSIQVTSNFATAYPVSSQCFIKVSLSSSRRRIHKCTSEEVLHSRYPHFTTSLFLDTASSSSRQDNVKIPLIKNDEVIPWNDVLVSLQPISCDPEDEECLQRQRMTIPVTESVNVASNSKISLTWKDQRNLGVTILSTLLIVAGLIAQSGPGSWRYYLAGAICATASHVIPVPIDTVKTRKQVDPSFAKLHFIPAFARIWREEGSKGLLAGLGPTAIGYALEGGIKFGVYEALKPFVAIALFRIATLAPWLYFFNTKVMAFAVCAAFSGVAASIVLCPMEALRIRMVANPDSQLGWFQTALLMIKTEGLMSLIKGMEPMIYKQVPYTITKNVSFDFITRYFYATIQNTWQTKTIGPIIKFLVPFTAAAAASILSCISSQPGDVLLSLVNAQQHDVRRTRDVIRDVLQSEKGWKGFYIGTKARFLHVGIVVTLQLLIYDLVKRICGIAATGISK